MRALLAVGAVSIAVWSCSEPVAVPRVSSGEVTPEMVTGAAAASLGADGRFTLALPDDLTGGVPLDTARAQAGEFARYVANNVLLRGVVEAGRGGYWTDPHLLTPCARPFSYIRAQLGPAFVDSLPPVGQDLFRRKYGDSWLIALCNASGLPEMTVQVAIRGNAVRFANGAPLSTDPNLLSAFSPAGVPLNWPDPLPISAERAVRFVWDQLGVRISALPELFVRGEYNLAGEYVLQAGSGRTCNRWRITLEEAVAIRSGPTQVAHHTAEVYVSALTCSGTDVTPLLQVPVSGQASEAELSYTDFGVVPPRVHTILTSVTSPVRFEIAHPVPRY